MLNGHNEVIAFQPTTLKGVFDDAATLPPFRPLDLHATQWLPEPSIQYHLGRCGQPALFPENGQKGFD
jgi:hypothetical protein